MSEQKRIIDKLYAEMKKEYGDRYFRASEAPPVKVISTGITSLDVATGVGGIPRGTLVEVFGRESVGKTALAIYAMAEVHKQNGFTGLINLESDITKEGWLEWAESIAPEGWDSDRCHIVNPPTSETAIKLFSKWVSSGGFDIVVYDSIGAMSTEKELEIGEKKQAYGQSALVTQLIKQAAHYAYEKKCVPILLNQVRDQATMYSPIEKAPGGHAKDHFASLRIHLKPNYQEFKNKKIKMDDKEIAPGFRVQAEIVKNKVGAPRRFAGWNYWNYPSPDGVIGIDTFQDTVDVALRQNVFRASGTWYYHDDFPDGKLQGGQKVIDFLRINPSLMKEVRQQLVMQAYHTTGSVMDDEPVEDNVIIHDGATS